MSLDDSCPDEATLVDFVEKRLAPADDELVRGHLDACAACRMLVGDLARGTLPPTPPARDLRTLAEGERLLDRYRILRFVARGGMGEVYEARDELLSDTVALKTLTCTALDQDNELRRLKAEVLTARRVTHPNVCRILEFGIHRRVPVDGAAETIPFLTMEFLRGETLRGRLERAGTLSPHEARVLLDQMLDALTAIHGAGVVHRDWKSDNLFLVGDSDHPRLVAMDFGLARQVTGTRSSWSSGGRIVGTVDYMAPEQVMGEPATVASDVYALGVVLFELLTGRVPFASATPTEAVARRVVEPAPPLASLRSDVPEGWATLVARCLEREPARRYQSAVEVREAARSVLDQPAVERHAPRLTLARVLWLCAIAAMVTWGAITGLRSRAPETTSSPAPKPAEVALPVAAVPAVVEPRQEPSVVESPPAPAPAPPTQKRTRPKVERAWQEPAKPPSPRGRDALLDPWR